MKSTSAVWPVWSLLIVCGLAVSCGGSPKTPAGEAAEVADTYDVKGVPLAMTLLPGGQFTMGAQPDSRLVKGAAAPHQVILDGYAVSTEPVSQALWKAVMGGNPASVQGDALPVDKVSYEDCQKFLKKLAKLTGVPFRLPTEAQWEFAQDAGAFTVLKNTREWVADKWSDETIRVLTENPEGPSEGAQRVVRTAKEREALAPFTKAGGLVFRVAVATGRPCDPLIRTFLVEQNPPRESVSSNEVIEVNGVKFNMIGVQGGTFKMGATEEQGDYGNDNEKPVTDVTVEDFEIGQTEVTARLWQAVMGVLPIGNDEKHLDKPVVNVSWFNCQDFLLRLGALTGRRFRLPTEAEWEYAARGGARSRHYRFAGSHEIPTVAAYTKNTDGKVVPVKGRLANELGIYDMSGNAWEWCQDRYHEYGKAVPEEEVPWHVMRGGSAASPWDACRVSNRQKIPASNTKGTFGLRLAL